MISIEAEKALAEAEDETQDTLVGLAGAGDPDVDTLDELVGPDAVPAGAVTNLDIQRAQERTLERVMGLRKPGPGELKPGEVPKMTTGPWATGDLFGVEPPTGEKIDGRDPSGSQRFRGIG